MSKNIQYLQNRKLRVTFWIVLALLVMFSFSKRGYAQSVFPYIQNFVISAYYSPLPGQEHYVTGTYESDIRLNGDGVKAADNTVVYPGMIAAQPEIPFGTKMDIPGLGIGTVHDRGGAIKTNRLDIWMGTGEEGMRRALWWGFREVPVTVYGVDENVKETLDFMSIPLARTGFFTARTVVRDPALFYDELKLGDRGESVQKLQEELIRLNYLRIESTGYYGTVTEHAVLKFQQSQEIVSSKDNDGAGLIGPKTREKLNNLIAARKNQTQLIAQKTNESKLLAEKREEVREIIAQAGEAAIVTSDLSYGMRGDAVRTLQETLKKLGYFDGVFTTDYFGDATKEAVLQFQKDHGLINSDSDQNAGVYNESTRKIFEQALHGASV